MSDFEITYAAHTTTCTFLLDANGICRRIVVAPGSQRSLSNPKGREHAKGRDVAKAAARCIGAQYVASLDATVSGLLTEKPRVGGTMLFARVCDRGRVSLVRTGLVTRFEAHRTEAEDPFVEPAKVPSLSVQTSAPAIAPSAPMPRRRVVSPEPIDPYEEDAGDPTQPFQAKDLRALRKRATNPPPSPESEINVDEDLSLNRTAEYESEPTARHATWPSPGAKLPATTLRHPVALPSEARRDSYAVPTPACSSPHLAAPTPVRSNPHVVPREHVMRNAERTTSPLVHRAAGQRRGDR